MGIIAVGSCGQAQSAIAVHDMDRFVSRYLLWRAVCCATQPFRAVDLHHAPGHDPIG
jgi:hypothetical protein